jgi:hydroxymethylglutaryl-CoA reductase
VPLAGSSRISGFHKLDQDQRLAAVQDNTGISDAQVDELKAMKGIEFSLADRLVENVISTISIPVGVATNMVIDGTDRLVTMATEESSVVAAVCNTARQCRDTGGFVCSTSGPNMIAQVQLVNCSDPEQARLKILEHREHIKEVCDTTDPILTGLGGGFRDLEVRVLQTEGGKMVIVHLIIDTRDAMGANAVNSMAESLAPEMAAWTGGKTYLRILSNLADRRIARARAVWSLDAIGGADVRDGIISAFQFADADPYRAATHNKGIMNGISAVVLATGNDTRAIEAGAHAYAAKDGWYRSLTKYEVTADGDLAGSIELPMAVGIVGGATKAHPTAKTCLDIMNITDADTLQRVVAATGLAQNFAALKALATVGIQKGHMSLHASNVAMAAGALGEEIDIIAKQLVAAGTVRQDIASQMLAEHRK